MKYKFLKISKIKTCLYQLDSYLPGLSRVCILCCLFLHVSIYLIPLIRGRCNHSTADVILDFSFSETGCLTKAKETNYMPINKAGKQIEPCLFRESIHMKVKCK